MVRLDGIRITKTLVILCIVLFLSGCTDESWRPDLNSFGYLEVFPDRDYGKNEDIDEDEEHGTSYLPSGTSTPRPAGTDKTVVIDYSKFKPTPHTFMEGEAYGKYLDEEVYKPLKEIIDSLPEGVQKSVFLRVQHCGYKNTKDKSIISKSSPYDRGNVSRATNIAGIAIPEFALEWLGGLPVNDGVVDIARRSFLNKIKTSGIPINSKWLLAETPNDNAKLVKYMWGNERLGAETIQDFTSLANTEILGVIPDLTLKYRTSTSSTGTIKLNPTTIVKGASYSDTLSTADVKKLFNKYNQYISRNAEAKTVNLKDEYSVVNSYIDGYNKTLIILGVESGKTLEEVFGSKLSEVEKIIQTIYYVTDKTTLSNKYPESDWILENARGKN